MKLIFLNIWEDSTVKTEAQHFLRGQANDTDVFCFQEATAEMRELMRRALPGYREITAEKHLSEDHFDQATYLRSAIRVTAAAKIFEDRNVVGLGIYPRICNLSNTTS